MEGLAKTITDVDTSRFYAACGVPSRESDFLFCSCIHVFFYTVRRAPVLVNSHIAEKVIMQFYYLTFDFDLAALRYDEEKSEPRRPT